MTPRQRAVRRKRPESRTNSATAVGFCAGHFARLNIDKRKRPVSQQPRVSDERGIQLLAHHRLDRVSPDRHDPPRIRPRCCFAHPVLAFLPCRNSGYRTRLYPPPRRGQEVRGANCRQVMARPAGQMINAMGCFASTSRIVLKNSVFAAEPAREIHWRCPLSFSRLDRMRKTKLTQARRRDRSEL